jgi:hypothetical protein
MLFVRAAHPHFAREGPLQILRRAGGDQSPLNAHCQRASSSWPDRHVAYARAEARVRQKAVLGLGDGRRADAKRALSVEERVSRVEVAVNDPLRLASLSQRSREVSN